MSESIFPESALGTLLERIARPVQVVATEYYRQIGIRSHGKGLFDKEPVLGAELGNKRVFWVEPDCFVVNIVFAWEQAVARTTQADKGKIASHRFPMFKPKAGKADIDFIAYLFKTDYGKELLGLASPGGAGRNKTLGQAEFLKIKIRVPPADEQRRIAKILSTWDRAIETVEALIANAEERKQSLMERLLTGKWRLHGYSGIWRELTLEKLAKITMGSSPPSSSYNNLGEGLPLIQGNADVKNGVSVPRIHTRLATQTCSPGDILFSVRAPVGEIAMSLHLACIGRGIAAIQALSKEDTEFLYFILLFAEPNWTTLSQGSTFQAINSKDLRGFTFFAPVDVSERQMIGHIIGEAQKAENILRTQLAALREEKSALMQQLLTGKRRVKFQEREMA